MANEGDAYGSGEEVLSLMRLVARVDEGAGKGQGNAACNGYVTGMYLFRMRGWEGRYRGWSVGDCLGRRGLTLHISLFGGVQLFNVYEGTICSRH